MLGPTPVEKRTDRKEDAAGRRRRCGPSQPIIRNEVSEWTEYHRRGHPRSVRVAHGQTDTARGLIVYEALKLARVLRPPKPSLHSVVDSPLHAEATQTPLVAPQVDGVDKSPGRDSRKRDASPITDDPAPASDLWMLQMTVADSSMPWAMTRLLRFTHVGSCALCAPNIVPCPRFFDARFPVYAPQVDILVIYYCPRSRPPAGPPFHLSLHPSSPHPSNFSSELVNARSTWVASSTLARSSRDHASPAFPSLPPSPADANLPGTKRFRASLARGALTARRLSIYSACTLLVCGFARVAMRLSCLLALSSLLVSR